MKRSRIRPISKKRQDQAEARAECRRIVLERDRTCRGLHSTPVRCQVVPSEVHELGRGSYRETCWLDPELCIGLCRPCHQWVTEHPHDAVEAGLAMWGWQIEQRLRGQ